jgi:hypothetical protein
MEIADYIEIENDKHVRGWAVRAMAKMPQQTHDFWASWDGWDDLPASAKQLLLGELEAMARKMASIARQAGVDLDD